MLESVIVIGGGLGSLCLANGLCNEGGLRCTVYEKDLAADVRGQGYRLHLDARGDDALRECLPTSGYRLHRAVRGPATTQFTVLTKRLRTLKVVPASGLGVSGTCVDRSTLKAVLLRGLKGVVRFGEEFTGYELLPDGRVRAHFASGATQEADLLVAADGVNSLVRRQFLPDALLIDGGVQVVFGRTLLTPLTFPLVPEPLHKGFAAVTDWPRGHGMALGLMRFHTPPAKVGLPPASDYVMWRSPRRTRTSTAAAWRSTSAAGIRAFGLWSTSPNRTRRARCGFGTPVRSADGEPVPSCCSATPSTRCRRAVAPARTWRCATPRGCAGNCSRRTRGELQLRTALDNYEEVMLSEGFAEVAASVQAPGEWFRRSRRPTG